MNKILKTIIYATPVLGVIWIIKGKEKIIRDKINIDKYSTNKKGYGIDIKKENKTRNEESDFNNKS